MDNGQELYNNLRQHTGGDVIYHHAQNKAFHYTAGVREFCQDAGGGAYWMLDIILSYPPIIKHVMEMGFAMVTLKVTGTKAVFEVRNDSGTDERDRVYLQEIPFTDCPEAPVTTTNPDGVWKFYIERGYVGSRDVPIMMLPQER